MRVLGVYTRDSTIYFELIKTLKDRNIPFISIDDPNEYPPEVEVVLVGPTERHLFKDRKVVEVNGDLFRAVDIAENILSGKMEYKEIVVGIDPGPKPGIAAVGDGFILKSMNLNSIEQVAPFIKKLMRTYHSKRWRLRMGHGDPVSRERIISSFSTNNVELEIVDESGTTSPGGKSDNISALRIALGDGRIIKEDREFKPTKGEIRNVQRLSRIRSGGKITIDKKVAKKVIEGELTIENAIEEKLKILKDNKKDIDK